jgi:predicted dehydrogenase
MASKTFNVGVVGYGMSAKVFHIPFIQTTPGLKLHSIVQRSPKDGNSAPADHPDAKHFTDFDSLLADPEVDVVVITTPPNNHFTQTKAVLEAGKHVLTEKPFVPTSEEAEKLIAIAKEKGRLICVYQNRRWDTDFLLVKHLISKGTLGRILDLDTHFDRYRAEAPTNWKGELDISQGGTAVFDLGTHLIDQAYVLFGMPQAVHGRLMSQREGRISETTVPDSVSAELIYANGLIVRVRIGVLSVETAQPRFWVRGSKGSFHKTGLDPQEDALKAGTAPTAAGFGREKAESMRLTLLGADGKPREQDVPDLEPQTYKAFYAAFAKAVQSGKEEDVPVKASEAKDVLRIIEAVVESAKTGKDIVFA